MRSACVAIVLLGLTAIAHGFSSGAPDDPRVCGHLTPKHGSDPQQNSASPYGLSVDKSTVRAGQTVTLSVISSNGSPIKGFLVQARKADSDDTTAYGTFVIDPSDSKGITCSDVPNSSITHSNNNPRDNLSVQWNAPKQSGKYVLLVTLVQDKLTYWVAQKSQTITVS